MESWKGIERQNTKGEENDGTRKKTQQDHQYLER